MTLKEYCTAVEIEINRLITERSAGGTRLTRWRKITSFDRTFIAADRMNGLTVEQCVHRRYDNSVKGMG